MTRDEVLELSDERDLWMRRLAADYRLGYRLGYADGDRSGYERGARLRESDPVRIDVGAPSLAELELRRWGPGGREHFGDPRLGDYVGGPVKLDEGRPS